MRKNWWNSILKGVTVALLALFVTACAGESGDDSGDSNSEDGEIKVWHYFSGVGEEAFNDLVDRFNEENEDITVDAEYVPFDQMKKQLSVGSAGETLPDIAIIDSVDNASIASSGTLKDITEKVESWDDVNQLLDGPLDSTYLDDKSYGMPIEANALGFFYNEDIFEEAGVSNPPETWEELLETSEKIKKETDASPFGMAGSKDEQTTFHFYSFLRSAGGEYTDLNSEESIEALDFETEMMEKGYMDGDILNSDQDEVATQFGAGDVAMMINGPWNIENIKEDYPDTNFGTAKIPKDKEFSSPIGGENMTVTKDGDEESSWEFITWVLEKENIENFTKDSGQFPPREDVLNESDHWKEDEHLKAFVSILEEAEPRGPSPNWSDNSVAIQEAIQSALTGDKTPEEAMKDASEKIEE